MANINEILARAASLRDETALNSIDPERAGGIMYDTLLALNELWLQQGAALVISKIYASVAAMNADTSPVSDLTGKPIRPGMIVVIASSDSDNGSVYRYNGTESPSWSLVGSIGNLDPVDSLDSDSTTLPLAAHQGKVLDGKISQLGQKEYNDILFNTGHAISEFNCVPYHNRIIEPFTAKRGYTYIFNAKKDSDSGVDCYLQFRRKDNNNTVAFITLTTQIQTLKFQPSEDIDVYVQVYANTNELVYIEGIFPSYDNMEKRNYSFSFFIPANSTTTQNRIPVDNSDDIYLHITIPPEYGYMNLYVSDQPTGNLTLFLLITKSGTYKIPKNTCNYIQIYAAGIISRDVEIVVDYYRLFNQCFINIDELNGDIQELDAQINYGTIFNVPSGTTGLFPSSAADSKIEESETYYIHIPSMGGATSIRFYLQSVLSATTVGDFFFMFPGIYKVETTAPAKFALLQFSGTTNTNIQITISKNALSQRVGYIENCYEPNKLIGKRIKFLGDSIMAANADTINPGGWAEIIATKNKMFYNNGGVGGATIAVTGQAGRACILTNLKQLNPAAWNYVIVQGGCNDSSLVPLGTISQDFIDEDAANNYDTSTFYGALEDMCRYMIKNFSNVKFGIIINYLFGQNANYQNTNAYLQAIENVCLKWGVPYIDLRKWASFNLICPTTRKIYGCVLESIPEYDPEAGYNVDDRVKIESGGVFVAYKCDSVIPAPAGAFNPSLWTEITDGYWWDSWHCNRLGYEVSTPKIESFIKSL